jgi:hypothetical protein
MNLLTASSVPDTLFSELKYLNAQDDNTAQRGCRVTPVHFSVRQLERLKVFFITYESKHLRFRLHTYLDNFVSIIKTKTLIPSSRKICF